MLGSLILLPYSGKESGSGPGLSPAQPGGPTHKVSALFFPLYMKTEAESSFWNVIL
jgi:hypothetical protein